MKLSEKGIETIFSALLKTIEERDLVFRRISQGVFKKHIEALNFEPADFESPHPFLESQDIENEKDKKSHHVLLTIEEAEILTRCAANEFYRLIMERGPVDLTRKVEALMFDLVKRIDQATRSKKEQVGTEKCDG